MVPGVWSERRGEAVFVTGTKSEDLVKNKEARNQEHRRSFCGCAVEANGDGKLRSKNWMKHRIVRANLSWKDEVRSHIVPLRGEECERGRRRSHETSARQNDGVHLGLQWGQPQIAKRKTPGW